MSICLFKPKQVEESVLDESESSRGSTIERGSILQYGHSFDRLKPEALASSKSQCFKLFGFIFIFFLFPLFAALPELPEHIEIDELPDLLTTILQYHNGKHELDEQILVQSHQHFFDQFDPYKIYLLEKEVHPYLTPKKIFVERIKKKSFETYLAMLNLCQQAIHRARLFRKQIQKPAFFFVPYETYAKNLTSLRARINRFIGAKIQEKTLSLPLDQARREIDQAMKTYEDKWLTLTKKDSQLAKHILQSILTSLDAHSKIMNVNQARKMRERLTKQGFGTGIELNFYNGNCVIKHVTKGSPADRAGLQPNDLVLSIQNNSTTSFSQSQLNELLNSEKRGRVSILVEREAKKIPFSIPRKTYTILEGRAEISYKTSPYGTLGILTLPSLYRGAHISASNDIKEILQRSKPKGLLLDLRNNTGGYLTEAVNVVGLFIRTGIVMSTVYSDGSRIIFRDLDPSILYKGPLIVLISNTTASSAEIVAQALLDYGNAIIVGDKRSYGKGSVQMQNITKTSNSIPMKMTIGTFYTVSGLSPQGNGVQADIVIPNLITKQHGQEQTVPKISPLFTDTLQDVPLHRLTWYHRYYVPYLQDRTDAYRKWIPKLLAYQAQQTATDENHDPQLEQAVNLLEELVRLTK